LKLRSFGVKNTL